MSETPPSLDDYRAVDPAGTIDSLRRLSERVRGRRLLQVSAEREVGGVAEILRGLVPLLEEVGVESAWETLDDDRASAAVAAPWAKNWRRLTGSMADPFEFDRPSAPSPHDTGASQDRFPNSRDFPGPERASFH